MSGSELPGPTSHIYISQRLRLHYLDWGNDDAPPLILLHGGRDHAHSWDWLAQVLRKDWHVIAPDLRGHGDSAWSSDGNYLSIAFVYDLAQLIHQLKLAPVAIIAHSLGGNVALRYAGLYPDMVSKLVAIEGLGIVQKKVEDVRTSWRNWVETRRESSRRQPRRYPTLEEAQRRMLEANNFLTVEQARHLTEHGSIQNEDGSYSWKFDPYLHNLLPHDLEVDEDKLLWRAIRCPTLLVWGRKSWASNPAKDGRAKEFADARVLEVEDAGHWVHHDQFEAFKRGVLAFLAAPERC